MEERERETNDERKRDAGHEHAETSRLRSPSAKYDKRDQCSTKKGNVGSRTKENELKGRQKGQKTRMKA